MFPKAPYNVGNEDILHLEDAGELASSAQEARTAAPPSEPRGQQKDTSKPRDGFQPADTQASTSAKPNVLEGSEIKSIDTPEATGLGEHTS